MRCDHPPVQEEAVQLCKKDLKPEVSEKLIGANVKTFDHLNSTVLEIEMFFADNPTLIQGKGEAHRERASLSKGVHAVDFTPLIPKTGGKNNNNASSSRQRGRGKNASALVAEKMSRPYSFAKEHTRKLFGECLQQQLITLPTSRRPAEADKVGEPNYCPYHRVLGHCIEDCFVFKDAAEQLIQAGVVNMRKFLIKPPQPHLTTQQAAAINVITPLPKCHGVNQGTVGSTGQPFARQSAVNRVAHKKQP